MAKLLIFAPCERVLIEQNGQAASLIIILHQIHFGIAEPESIPPDAVAAMKWSAFALWEMEAGDHELADLRQRIKLVSAVDGKVAFDHTATFGLVDYKKQPLHRMIANLDFFPLVPTGDYRLKLMKNESADESMWEDCADYPLQILYANPEAIL